MRSLVLVSGGLDSAVALGWAMAEGHEALALTFEYPGRPRGEREAARAVLDAAGVRERRVVELPFLREAQDAAPEVYRGAPEGYIPFRNATFYAIACHQAQVEGCDLVVGGHNRDDAALFPDAHDAFFRDLQALLARGAWPVARMPRLVMPLLGLDRGGVLALGERLGVPLRRTWSCYEDGEGPCGRCPACARRGIPSEATG